MRCTLVAVAPVAAGVALAAVLIVGYVNAARQRAVVTRGITPSTQPVEPGPGLHVWPYDYPSPYDYPRLLDQGQ